MVYVDAPIWPYRGMMMCHMWADTREELDAMADRIGVARKWIQLKRAEFPHYDIAKSKRALAVSHGAIESSHKDLVAYATRQRELLLLGDELRARCQEHQGKK